jgi:hypothetical protein
VVRNHLSLEQIVVIAVVADPKPHQAFCPTSGKGSEMQSYSDRPKRANFLQSQRGMMRVEHHEREVLIRQFPYDFR